MWLMLSLRGKIQDQLGLIPFQGATTSKHNSVGAFSLDPEGISILLTPLLYHEWNLSRKEVVLPSPLV